MKYIKDKKIIALGIVLLVFTIGYFIVVSRISYSFVQDYNSSETYNILINTIKECSIAYAKSNKDLFKEDKIAYIKVQDLIDKGLLVANEDGNIINPLNSSETLNSNIIKLKVDDGEISASVDS